eukprot:TRINITY_DN34648_c0_g1_i1.p1 TRINITY_DN34648_c0_g1~~TRINITY_DN34648_c0_g1_i1.p1  ORF type:complete len:141 (-),score=12.56 TRINITY_DN34648_c0_g1_i1:101-523(-)
MLDAVHSKYLQLADAVSEESSCVTVWQENNEYHRIDHLRGGLEDVAAKVETVVQAFWRNAFRADVNVKPNEENGALECGINLAKVARHSRQVKGWSCDDSSLFGFVSQLISDWMLVYHLCEQSAGKFQRDGRRCLAVNSR